ncbi:MAG: hypothetical protein AB7F22_07700 [Reyranella sp.]|uniref:hypothetical protein n=1 Tax=Reyranella sp. TaxID=1929291 RepID=UPI003D0B5B76
MEVKEDRTSPLLELLDQRWNDIIKDIPDPTRDRPARRPFYPTQAPLYEAARLHGEADANDPFAAARALHYMRQGYWLPSDVKADALRRTSTRRAEGVTFPAVQVAA